MYKSDEWTEYHLTPRGWEVGTSKTDYNKTEKKCPDDAVQTVKVREFGNISNLQIERTHTIEWQTPDEGLLAKLQQQFGDAPEQI
ncbi:hypothetical protein [Endobacterium cereale]|uniref:hypothetical protein n=1 Tax=Endobacterium cereale TaxID=2663029 RepID=UPI002B48E5FF|nr:hypothetical protein [Endobacterium cereale]MEB2843793.1 hypothetical protein [Endobacterium cereale]